MKILILIAGAALLASGGPALAKPPHAGQGKAHGPAKARSVEDDQAAKRGYGVGGCPPGLEEKNAECMPPGLHRKLFGPGQSMPKRRS